MDCIKYGDELHVHFSDAKNIFVKTLTGKTYEFLFDPNMTVYELKKEIKSASGTEPKQQRLIFAGKQLEEERKLSDYGIKAGSMLHLILRLQGGNENQVVLKTFGGSS